MNASWILIVVGALIEIGPTPRMLDAYGVSMPANCTHRFGSNYLSHPGIRHARLNGTSLVSAGADGFIRFWDIAQRKESYKLKLPAGNIWDMKISESQQHVCAVYNDKVLILNINSERVTSSIDYHGSDLVACDFSPDESEIALLDEDGEVAIANINTGIKRVAKVRLKREEYRQNSTIRYSRDGKYLSCGLPGANQAFVVLDTKKMTEVVRQTKLPDSVFGLFSRHDRVALYEEGQQNGKVVIYDTLLGKSLFSIDIPSKMDCQNIRLSNDDKLMAVGVYPTRLLLIDIDQHKIVFDLNEFSLSFLEFSNDNKTLIFDDSMLARLWDVQSRKEINASPHVIYDVQVEESSGLLYHRDINRQAIHVWDIDRSQFIRSLPIPHLGEDDAFDEHSIYYHNNQVIRLNKGRLSYFKINKKTPELIKSHQLESVDKQEDLVIRPGLPNGIVATSVNNVRIWDLNTGRKRVDFSYPEGTNPDSISLSKDGSLIALSINEKTQVYDLKTGMPLGWSVPSTGNYHFAPDNSLLAVNCPSFKDDQKPCLKIYKVSNGDELFSGSSRFRVGKSCLVAFEEAMFFRQKRTFWGFEKMLR